MQLSARFTTALVFAAELHDGQSRKGTGIPYLSHLLAAASLVLEHGGGEDEAIAALLHDAIEDQAEHHGGPDALRQEIRARFGSIVTEIVDGCTDAAAFPKPPWRQRKQDYLRRLSNANGSLRLVSCADKLHNARSILQDFRIHGEQLWERFHGRKEGTLWYYRALVDAFRRAGASPLVDELDRVVTEIEALAQGGHTHEPSR